MRAGVRSLGFLLFLAIVFACGGAAPTSSPAPSSMPQTTTATTTPAPSPLTVRDDAGRVVTLSSPPKRIVSATPSTTELAFAVGLGDDVVAVDKFSNYPPEASSRTSIGSYIDPDQPRGSTLAADPSRRVDAMTLRAISARSWH